MLCLFYHLVESCIDVPLLLRLRMTLNANTCTFTDACVYMRMCVTACMYSVMLFL